MKSVLILLLLTSGLVTAQTTDIPDTWKPLRVLVGAWEGTGKGEPGDSKVDREYKFTLANKLIQVTHRSNYAPQPKNPKGETHDDLGFFSYDKTRKQIVFHQFHVVRPTYGCRTN